MATHAAMSSVWDRHIASEFVAKSADQALATMAAEPYVNVVPLMIGARGRAELHEFYECHFLNQIPPDMEMVPVSRTIGHDRIVDELIMRFTHSIRMNWLLPGIPPTGKRVELPFVVIVQFEGEKLAHEHLYWDQATVLVQVGLLGRSLPVRGGETAAQVLAPTQPMNELIRRVLESEKIPRGPRPGSDQALETPMDSARVPHAAPEAELLRLIFGKNISMALAIVARLRIADRLGEGPRAVDDLAAETGTHSPSLRRILRTLASVGVFTERTDGVFALTPTGAFLQTGVKGSLRGLADALGSDWCWRSWGHASEAVRTGRTAFDTLFGEPAFVYLDKHPDDSAVFSEAMSGFTSNVAPAVASAYDFSSFGTVVDVGGGHGVLLAAVLRAYPNVKGVVYDVPHVAAGAEDTIREQDLLGRCRVLGGDFFERVPAGGDAYLLKHIIHDWSDDEATKILRHCRAEVNPGGKLLLVEMVVAPGDAADIAKLIDLELLVNLTGRERTEAEYRQLIAKAGWRLTQVIPTESPTQILEAEPA